MVQLNKDRNMPIEIVLEIKKKKMEKDEADRTSRENQLNEMFEYIMICIL